jgi:hypothetical protein
MIARIVNVTAMTAMHRLIVLCPILKSRFLLVVMQRTIPHIASMPPEPTIHKTSTGCGIRGKAATDSDGKRPPNPIESGHRFRTKAATLLIG